MVIVWVVGLGCITERRWEGGRWRRVCTGEGREMVYWREVGIYFYDVNLVEGSVTLVRGAF